MARVAKFGIQLVDIFCPANELQTIGLGQLSLQSTQSAH